MQQYLKFLLFKTNLPGKGIIVCPTGKLATIVKFSATLAGGDASCDWKLYYLKVSTAKEAQCLSAVPFRIQYYSYSCRLLSFYANHPCTFLLLSIICLRPESSLSTLLIIFLWSFQVRLVTDKESNKPRGYAFIEYMHTRDMKGSLLYFMH